MDRIRYQSCQRETQWTQVLETQPDTPLGGNQALEGNEGTSYHMIFNLTPRSDRWLFLGRLLSP